ncbi:MAG: hypothetical protein WCV88_06300 [Patescibacteria group bacterium]|jgi:hypothetical protein
MDNKLPNYFRPLFWSYDFSLIDPQQHQKTIMVNTINYGNLHHWKWLKQYYGKQAIQTTLEKVATTELHPRSKTLAQTLFQINLPNHVSRGFARS